MTMVKRTAVTIDFDTLGLLRGLAKEDKESQTAIVTRLIQEEVDRRGGIQVFEPRKEILLLKELYEQVCELIEDMNDMDHKTFVALARQQKQLMQLTFASSLIADYLGIQKTIAKQAYEAAEEDWPETARMFGYNVLPVEEGGLGEYPDESESDEQ